MSSPESEYREPLSPYGVSAANRFEKELEALQKSNKKLVRGQMNEILTQTADDDTFDGIVPELEEATEESDEKRDRHGRIDRVFDIVRKFGEGDCNAFLADIREGDVDDPGGFSDLFGALSETTQRAEAAELGMDLDEYEFEYGEEDGDDFDDDDLDDIDDDRKDDEDEDDGLW